MPYDIFISYSRRDNKQGRVTQLVERIKQDFAPFAKRELAPFLDVDEIHGMQDWRQRILQGLREVPGWATKRPSNVAEVAAGYL